VLRHPNPNAYPVMSSNRKQKRCSTLAPTGITLFRNLFMSK